MRKVEKASVKYATEMAQKKYKTTNVSFSQIKEFKLTADSRAAKDIVSERNYGGNRFQPRTLLRRKMYLGERMLDKNGKWIDGL